MPSLDDHIATYLAALQVEGKTTNTISSYTNSLADFRTLGRKLELPEHANEYAVAHVYALLAAMRDRGSSAAYQHRRHREVKACFSWFRRMGIVDENPFARVPLVRRPQVIKPPFKPAQVQKLLDAQNLKRHAGTRNYALILFLLDTGIRASECVGLHLEDIDWDSRRALVRHGKGEKQRLIGFGERTADALWSYIERFRGLEDGALFRTIKGMDLAGPHSLDVVLKRVGNAAGVEKVHPHRFRHTFATWAIESGAREIDVQLLLGHSDLTMTHRYARTYTTEQAVRAHGELSPVKRLVS